MANVRFLRQIGSLEENRISEGRSRGRKKLFGETKPASSRRAYSLIRIFDWPGRNCTRGNNDKHQRVVPRSNCRASQWRRTRCWKPAEWRKRSRKRQSRERPVQRYFSVARWEGSITYVPLATAQIRETM